MSRSLLALVMGIMAIAAGCASGGNSGGAPGTTTAGGTGGGNVATPPIAYLELAPKIIGVPLSDVGVIHLVTPDGTVDTTLTGLPPVTFGPPRWSRDGNSIAATAVLPNEQQPFSSLYTFAPTGANFKKVTDVLVQPTGFPASFPVFAWWSFNPFSPDGNSISFVPIFSIPNQSSLYGTAQLISPISPTQNPVITTEQSPFNLNGDGNGFGLDWSPTSNLVVASAAQFSTYYTFCPSVVGYPFPGEPADVVELFSLNPGSNTAPVQVTNILSADPIDQMDRIFVCGATTLARMVSKVLPVFSPDGTRIAYVQWNVDSTTIPSSVTTDIRMVDVSGQNLRIVQRFPNKVSFGVSWSPDGHQLVFDLGTAVPLITFTNFQAVFPFLGSKGLWLINVDNCLAPGVAGTGDCGTNLTGPITKGGVNAVAPSWRGK